MSAAVPSPRGPSIRRGRRGSGARSAVAPALLVAVTVAGCAPESEPGGDRSVAVDSAGVRIVESSAPTWTPETAWRLSPEPALTLGAVEGLPEDQLFDVVDAARLPDGRVVIANRGSSEIKIFGPSGDYEMTLGRAGDGPGEFGMLARADVVPGDSIFAWDQRQQRLSVFSAGSGFVRTMRLTPPGEGALPRFEGRFADGTLFARLQLFASSELEDASIQGSEAIYMRYGADGVPLDTIARFRGSRSLLKFSDGGGTLSVLSIPFEPATRIAISADAIYEGDGATYEVRILAPSGALRRIVRRPADAIDVTEELMMADFEAQYGRFAEQEDYYRSVREGYEAMPVEGRVAAFDALLVSSDGTVWARNHPLPGDPTHTWSVFAPDGAWLGELPVSAGLRLLEAGPDYVLGRVLDDFDVEHVVVHQIVKP